MSAFDRVIGYNFQGDNISFSKKFSGWIQCFTTSAWMFMSFWSKKIDASDDTGLSDYLDDVEITIGKPGIAEKMIRKYNWIKGKTSLWWLIQKAGIEDWLWRHGVKGQLIYWDGNMPFNHLFLALKRGPIILQTTKMGGLKGGHIILVVDYEDDFLVCHDPAGDANTNYSPIDKYSGAYVKYHKDFLIKYTGKSVRCMYWSTV